MSEIKNPIELFNEWFEEAKKSESLLPEATCLATSSKSGFPSARMVLLKAVDERGFVFYTNLNSIKSQNLTENPLASLCFHWKSLRKQIRIEGEVEPVSEEEADAYFASRPRQSQIGAWASSQSSVMENSFDLEKAVARYAIEFGVGKIPRPEFWSGFRVKPSRIEFWQDKVFRLHDRYEFKKDTNEWIKNLLYP